MDFYGFFNGIYTGTDEDGFELYDREYDANDLARVIGAFYLNGIFPYESNYFQVIPKEKFDLNILPGQGHIEGRFFKLDRSHEITISDPEAALQRIDRVVIRLDVSKRTIEFDVLKGTPSGRPTAKRLTRTSNIYELGIADITVRNGARAISSGDIKDTRFNDELCGVVAHSLKRLDVEDLREQYGSELEDLVSYLDNIVLNNKNSVDKMVADFEELLKNLESEAKGDVTTATDEFKAFINSNRNSILSLLKDLNDIIGEEDVAGELISKLNDKQDKYFSDEINSNKYQLVFKNGELYKREVR